MFRKIWNAIKKWHLESLDAMEEGSVATSMWVDGYTDFEIDQALSEIRNEKVHL